MLAIWVWGLVASTIALVFQVRVNRGTYEAHWPLYETHTAAGRIAAVCWIGLFLLAGLAGTVAWIWSHM